LVRGLNMSRGYWNRPAETAAASTAGGSILAMRSGSPATAGPTWRTGSRTSSYPAARTSTGRSRGAHHRTARGHGLCPDRTA
jgi:hypothetical protein